MEILSKGDIVRTPRGYIGSVNWDDGKLVGVTYIEKVFKSLAGMTFKKEELFVVKRGTQTFFKEMFEKISDEELREQIKQERAMRAVIPTREQKVARKRDNVKGMLKELTSEDQKALVEFIKMKKGIIENEV